MAKILKKEPERQQINPDQAENENTDASPVDATPVDTGASNFCDHDWVFNMSVPVKDEPDKRLVYLRCVKCNEIKTTIKDCHV